MPPLPRVSPPSLSFLRTFSTTLSQASKSSNKRLALEHVNVPTYPYGPSMFYKQSNFGLYGMQKIRYGNIVSEKNEIKTRRHWRPNVHSKRLWSAYLKRHVRIRVTTRVLRTIDKCGGLDEYLLGEKAGRIKELGMGGWALRWRIMGTEGAKERFRLQREALGLSPKDEPILGLDGGLVGLEQQAEEMRRFDQEMDKDDREMVFEDAGEANAPRKPGFMEEAPAKGDKLTL